MHATVVDLIVDAWFAAMDVFLSKKDKKGAKGKGGNHGSN